MDTLSKARTLETLAIIQKGFESKADKDVIEKINKKSLEIIKEI